MPDHQTIYQQEAERYDRMVMREDVDGNILHAIREIIDPAGLDVVELGAGTGRLTTLLAPLAHSIRIFDASAAMLAVAIEKLQALGLGNWQAQTADHRVLPVADASADLAISGWSICYLVDWAEADWQGEVRKALAEMRRILRPDGTIVIIETMGTGVETPQPPEKLLAYYRLLEAEGFVFTWFRTDYRFASMAEAEELVPFFFGQEMLSACRATGEGVILPECTGMWWHANKKIHRKER
ncbi:MAG: class I SAM-dependent methyltransferase [Anaerolineae bacterium]|nr:class I SAM-dependent methyltransferase [Anaerolineae bacterium]